MKKIILTITATLFAIITFAGDILTLNNKMFFNGKVTKIKDCDVVFKTHRNKYIIKASDIFSCNLKTQKSRSIETLFK
jgi:hypothetical protein